MKLKFFALLQKKKIDSGPFDSIFDQEQRSVLSGRFSSYTLHRFQPDVERLVWRALKNRKAPLTQRIRFVVFTSNGDRLPIGLASLRKPRRVAAQESLRTVVEKGVTSGTEIRSKVTSARRGTN